MPHALEGGLVSRNHPAMSFALSSFSAQRLRCELSTDSVSVKKAFMSTARSDLTSGQEQRFERALALTLYPHERTFGCSTISVATGHKRHCSWLACCTLSRPEVIAVKDGLHMQPASTRILVISVRRPRRRWRGSRPAYALLASSPTARCCPSSLFPLPLCWDTGRSRRDWPRYPHR